MVKVKLHPLIPQKCEPFWRKMVLWVVFQDSFSRQREICSYNTEQVGKLKVEGDWTLLEPGMDICGSEDVGYRPRAKFLMPTSSSSATGMHL